MNVFLQGLKDEANYGLTENGAVKLKSTKSALLDMFAMGAAMRNRLDNDILFMFDKAMKENPLYALKCLFYIRDITEGQGERRFFRVCLEAIGNGKYDNFLDAKGVIRLAPIYGRWDDLYSFVGTKHEKDALDFMKEQLILDTKSKTPSLLAKWLKSENTSSKESRRLAEITRIHLGMNHKQYRKTLSVLRARINVLERLMSAGEWDKIEFDKIPSVAGFKYRNAFARHDVERKKSGARTYESFIKDDSTKVNAKTLYPYQCVEKALRCRDNIERAAVNKYWENLTDYFNEAKFNGLAIVDTSGSMNGTPLEVAISLGMYCADKAKGPFHNHFISFSEIPTLQTIEGVDFCDKVRNISKTNWGFNTNIEAAFDLMLDTAIKNNIQQEDLPENLIVISDMEFDSCMTGNAPLKTSSRSRRRDDFIDSPEKKETLFDGIRAKWEGHGYKMPKLTFWNVDARSDNIPMKDDGNVRYVSGFSPVLFQQIMKDLTAWDLMMDKLNSERYSAIK